MHSWLVSRIACVLLLLSSVLYVDGLQQNQHSDIAHRPRTGGPSVFPRINIDEGLLVYFEKGVRNLYLMRGQPCFPPANRFGTKDLADNNWIVSEQPPGEERVTTVPKELLVAFQALGLSRNWDDNQIFYIDHEGPGSTKNGERYHQTSGYFYNAFNPTCGVIISLNNLSPLAAVGVDELMVGEPFEMPPLHRFSDIVMSAWSKDVDTRSMQRKQVMPLRYWFRLVPPGDSQTREVMRIIAAMQRRNKVPPIPSKQHRTTGWTFDIQDPGERGVWAKALLGTPHGNGVTQALSTNPRILGGHSIVDQVSMMRLDADPESQGSWVLMFGIRHLGDQPPFEDLPFMNYQPPDDSPSNDPPLPDPQDYYASVRNGQVNLKAMGGQPNFPTPNRYKTADLVASGWTLGYQSPSRRGVAIPDAITSALRDRGVVFESGETNLFYVDLKPAWDSYYYSAFNYAQGIIISLESRSPHEARLAGKEITIPKIHEFSDVIPLVNGAWISSKKQYPPSWPLKFWAFSDIKLPSFTAQVMLQVMSRHQPNLQGNEAFPPPPPGWTFAVGDEQGQALLGTPQGRAVAMSLVKNPLIFGKSHRIVTEVSMFRTSMTENGWTAGLIFEIGELPPAPVPINLGDAAEKGQALYNLMKGWPHFPEAERLKEADLKRDNWNIDDVPSVHFKKTQGLPYIRARWPAGFKMLFTDFDRHRFTVVFVDQMQTAVESHNSHYYNAIDVFAGIIISLSHVSPEEFKKVHPAVPTPHVTRYSDIIGVIYSEYTLTSSRSPLKVWGFPIAKGSPAYLMVAAMIIELRETPQRKVPPEYPGWHFQVRNDPQHREKYARALLTTPEGRDVVDALVKNEHYFGGRRIVDSVRIYGFPRRQEWYLVFYMAGLKATRKRPASQELPHRGPGEGSSRHGPYD